MVHIFLIDFVIPVLKYIPVGFLFSETLDPFPKFGNFYFLMASLSWNISCNCQWCHNQTFLEVFKWFSWSFGSWWQTKAYKSTTFYTCQPTIYKLSWQKEGLQIYSFFILKVVDSTMENTQNLQPTKLDLPLNWKYGPWNYIFFGDSGKGGSLEWHIGGKNVMTYMLGLCTKYRQEEVKNSEVKAGEEARQGL